MRQSGKLGILHTHRHTRAHARTQEHTRKHAHTHTHTHTHARTHARTHTHTHTLARTYAHPPTSVCTDRQIGNCDVTTRTTELYRTAYHIVISYCILHCFPTRSHKPGINPQNVRTQTIVYLDEASRSMQRDSPAGHHCPSAPQRSRRWLAPRRRPETRPERSTAIGDCWLADPSC